MSSDKKCCVPGCFESGASHKVLHLFPNPNKDPDRVEAWRKAVGGKILELSFEHIYKYRRVCRAHFEDKFHCRYERLSLSIPTVNMAGEERMAPTQAIASDELNENTPVIELPIGYLRNLKKRVKMKAYTLAESTERSKINLKNKQLVFFLSTVVEDNYKGFFLAKY
ncbi:uncharacterized protein LOC110998957 isoform X1 [Pieris rapae]|uniref:uncharacterized protein LOC110998957 isoform X1 n=1 Tax=Pieris rapae TaxID=64459 RepID=UPI001E27A844|nr:uncharacterized protein LOC110998957 isoform X1 [Pieris rapae]